MEPKDVHTNDGKLSVASTPETADEAASRDDQGEQDQRAAQAPSVQNGDSASASSAQHGDSASVSSAQHGDSAYVSPKLNSGSSVFEDEQEREDQDKVRLKSSLPGDSDLEGSILFEDKSECEGQEKASVKSSLSEDSNLKGSIVFINGQEYEHQNLSLLDDSDLENSFDQESSSSSSFKLPLRNEDDRRDKGNNKNTQEGDSNDQDDSETSEEKEEKDDSLIWKVRLFCGKIVNNEFVQIAIISLIIINAVVMGVATFDFVTEDPRIDNIFEKVDRSFLVIFTIEVAMQLFYLGLTLFTHGWLTFDFLIVVLSWSFESLQVVRAFRIFRAFRLFSRVKPLRDLVLAIGAVMPRMSAIGALLLLIFYIFSVLFTELFKDLPLSDNYFGTLDASLFTCMELMTLEWGTIVREVMIHRSWAWAPFTTFIALTGFIVFNLIVAVVCDAVAVTEKTVRELDGIESENPYTKIDEAQERIDLLQCHIEDMLRTQHAVQDMIEIMAGELLHLEVEQMRSGQREVELRIQLERRKDFEKSMQTTRQLEGLQRTTNEEKDRRAKRRVSHGELSSSHHGLQRIANEENDRRALRRGGSNSGLRSSSHHSRQSLSRSDRNLGTRSRNSRINSSARSLGARSRRSDPSDD